MKPPRSSAGVPSLLPPACAWSGDAFLVTLRWSCRVGADGSDREAFEVALPVARDAYARASGELAFTPLMPEEYAAFVLQGPMEPVQQLAAQLREQSQRRGYTPVQEVENVVHLVRGLRYWSDAEQPHAVDQPKYPVQTLVDGGGDCEDFSILTAALLWTLEHPVALIYLETEATAHMAIGYPTDDLEGGFTVKGPDDRCYVYIETVPTEAALGELPGDMMSGLQSVVVIPL